MGTTSKQFRLTLPEEEGLSIIQQAIDEGFDTPQQLILHRLRQFEELQTKLDNERKEHREHEKTIVQQRDGLKAELEKLQGTDAQIKILATTKTEKVLEVISNERYELLMLYAFRLIFPEKVPEAVTQVMEAYSLTPGVYYMRHVCEQFPEYVAQIKKAAQKAAEAQAEARGLKQQVAKIEAERDELKLKLTDAESLKSALKVVLRDDDNLEELCQRLHVRLIGETDFQDAVEYMLELGGASRHQDYVSRALRKYHVYKRKDVEGQLESAQSLITENANKIQDLKRDLEFYKNKSWWQRLWELIGGGVQEPKPVPPKANDDDIPF